MKFPRRTFLHLAAGAAALPALPRISRAQAYPSRPVRIVVGFAAGGATDIQARLMGQWLSDRLGQQFIIENRAGIRNDHFSSHRKVGEGDQVCGRQGRIGRPVATGFQTYPIVAANIRISVNRAAVRALKRPHCRWRSGRVMALVW
jgi:hypothetical protein